MWRRVLLGLLVLISGAALIGSLVVNIGWFLQAPGNQLGIGGTPGTMVLALLVPALPPLGWTAAGWLLAAVRPGNPLGWIFLAGGVVLSLTQMVGAMRLLIGDFAINPFPWYSEITRLLTFVLLLAVPTVILALYPNGRLAAPWWRWPVGLAIVGIVVEGSIIFLPAEIVDVRWPALDDTIGMFLIAPATVTILLATVVRWCRAVRPQRQQLAWFAGCVAVSYGSYFLVTYFVDLESVGAFSLPLMLLDPLTGIPIGVAVGVLRYQLLGIKAVLRRGLVYGALTFLVFVVYVAVTATVGRMLDRGLLPGVVVAAVVAVGLAPARDWLQRAADRLVYGARRDPLQALTELGDRVAADRQLDLAAATVAAAVRAEGAVIVAPDGAVLARAGETPERFLALPLRFGGTALGELRVAEPGGGERYSAVDRRLLTALAAQLAVVVSATELAEALEAERVRVVAATRDERDRLRRDLHDGLGPSLTGMSLGLQALGGLVGGADPRAGELVGRLRAETDTAVRDIRRIIDGLRPTALDTAGLTRAVERHAGALNATLPVDVVAGSLPVLAPDVEVAAYRIITEALTNAARHAHAHHARVTISADRALHIAVRDDGRGMHGDGAGVGLSSMRRRAEELGGGLAVRSTDGGTTVTATLPL